MALTDGCPLDAGSQASVEVALFWVGWPRGANIGLLGLTTTTFNFRSTGFLIVLINV
jgi:hypothetical protein